MPSSVGEIRRSAWWSLARGTNSLRPLWLANLAVAITLIVIGWSADIAGAAIKVRGVPGVSNFTVAKFDKLKCSKGKSFTAKARDGKWRFELIIDRRFFHGFRRYEIEYGNRGPADFVARAGNLEFSNLTKPETGSEPELTLGGSVAFAKRGKLMKIAFPLAYDSPLVPDPVIATIIGKAPCRY
jgi:hypothetical protein